MEDKVLADWNTKIPFGRQAAYRGVYEAKVNGTPCIIKSLRDILAGAGDVSPEQVAGAVGRFRDQCVLLSKLRHPNVLQFLGVQVGSEASDFTLVLERPHTSLDDCLGRRKAASSLVLPVTLSILRDVSLGLLYLHSHSSPSIVHGDLHTRNVLLTRDMTAKIADLGTTKLLGYNPAAPATLDHLPPEAMAALRAAPFLSNSNCKVDIFSFGVLCLRVAAESTGNEGEAQRTRMLEHAQHSPLHPLVLKCLHDNQEKRPSAGEVCTEMDGLCLKFHREPKNILEIQEELIALKNRYSQLLDTHGQMQQKQARTMSMSAQRDSSKTMVVSQGPSHILPPGSVKSFGHVFEKKTYFQPTYCQHCTKMLWGLKEQGLECKVCNFISHERCASQLVILCLQATPQEENMGGEHHLVRLEQCDGKAFCSVCRRKISSDCVFCQVCHQYSHAGCGTTLFKACRDCASYSKPFKNAHHWIEGNLPAGSLCGVCGKVCATSDCLSGFRCCWCGVTIHSSCKSSYRQGNCDYGDLKPIILPPRAVYTHTSVLISQATPEESSSDAHPERCPFSPGLDQRQCIVTDGRLLTLPVTRATMAHDILAAGLKMLASSGESCHLVELLDNGEEKAVPSTEHLFSLQKGSNVMRLVVQQKKPGSQRDVIISNGCLPCSLAAVEVNTTSLATVSEIITMSLRTFQIEGGCASDYCLVEVCSDVEGRVMRDDECPLWSTSSAHQYILRQRHGYEGIVIYLWGIPQDVLSSEAIYTQHIKGIIGRASPGLLTEALLNMVKIGPAYPTHGGLFIEFPTMDVACKVCAALQESQVKVTLLPSIYPDQLDAEQEALLVFINERSGGNQGRSLLSGFRRHLNPYQVFNLAEGGPLPGLFAFRKVKRFSVLIGGGDGTFGWVLSSITDIQPLLTCDNPPCALLPLGTGNDLARALKWGPGYTGEKVMDLLNGLRGVETVDFDRWEISFSDQSGAVYRTSVMNNYFGIGLDAAIALDFHNAREENPDKFNSRFRNKSVFLQLGLQKMVKKTVVSNITPHITIQADDEPLLRLPDTMEGLVFLNIQSWGGGSDPWGNPHDSGFRPATYSDGLLEMVDFSGVMRMGQILSGIQGGHRLKQVHKAVIELSVEMPVQVDGEAWLVQPGKIAISKLPVQAKMRVKRRRPNKDKVPTLRHHSEPFLLVDTRGDRSPLLIGKDVSVLPPFPPDEEPAISLLTSPVIEEEPKGLLSSSLPQEEQSEFILL